MPINQEPSGTVVLEFGHGDIVVAEAFDESDLSLAEELCFYQSHVAPIGTPAPDCWDDEVFVAVRMRFTKRASIDNIIRHLNNIKNAMPEDDKE